LAKPIRCSIHTSIPANQAIILPCSGHLAADAVPRFSCDVPVTLACQANSVHRVFPQIDGERGTMTIVDSTYFRFGLLLAAMVMVAMWPRSSAAYTPEQQQACSPDAMRLCGAFIPDVDMITACMVRNKAQLSPPCRVFFVGPDPEERRERRERRRARPED
jgi:hypothetical protein